MTWTFTSEKLHPDAPGVRKHESVLCLIQRGGDIRLAQWNCTYLCWDDEEGDDFLCKPDEVKAWQCVIGPSEAAAAAQSVSPEAQSVSSYAQTVAPKAQVVSPSMGPGYTGGRPMSHTWVLPLHTVAPQGSIAFAKCALWQLTPDEAQALIGRHHSLQGRRVDTPDTRHTYTVYHTFGRVLALAQSPAAIAALASADRPDYPDTVSLDALLHDVVSFAAAEIVIRGGQWKLRVRAWHMLCIEAESEWQPLSELEALAAQAL